MIQSLGVEKFNESYDSIGLFHSGLRGGERNIDFSTDKKPSLKESLYLFGYPLKHTNDFLYLFIIKI